MLHSVDGSQERLVRMGVRMGGGGWGGVSECISGDRNS